VFSISPEEEKCALYRHLLHDIGHAPLHAMEKSIVENAS
jgi:HD superfamily phosphohydrolase